MAKKKKSGRGSKRGINSRKPSKTASPGPEMDQELDALIQDNQRERIANNVARYSTEYLLQALAETKMASEEALDRGDAFNATHSARYVEIMEEELARRPEIKASAEADAQNPPSLRLQNINQAKAIATAATQSAILRKIQRQRIKFAAAATAADARGRRHCRDQVRAIAREAAAAALIPHQQEILADLSAHAAWVAGRRAFQRRWMQLSAIATAKEARRRRRANQIGAVARAAAAAASIRRQRRIQIRDLGIATASKARQENFRHQQQQQKTNLANKTQSTSLAKRQTPPPKTNTPSPPNQASVRRMYATGGQQGIVSRVPANERLEDMIERVGEELDKQLAEISVAEDPELRNLEKQNKYFRDSWIELGQSTPAEQPTNFECGYSHKGAGECSKCNNSGGIFGKQNNTSLLIKLESRRRYRDRDQDKTPPKAEPAKEPPPELDKIPRDRGQRSRVPNGTAKGCAKHLTAQIVRSPDTGVAIDILSAVGTEAHERPARNTRKHPIGVRRDTRSSRRPRTCGRYNTGPRERRLAGQRPSSRWSHSFPAHANHIRYLCRFQAVT